MSALDIGLVALTIYAVVSGLARGLISQVIDLAAFVFALTLGLSLNLTVAHAIDRVLALPEAYQPLIGFAVVFGVVGGAIRMGLRLIGHLIPGFLAATLMNRLLGVVPALAQLTLAVTIALNAVASVPQWTVGRELVASSKFAPIFLAADAPLRSLVDRLLGPSLARVGSTLHTP